MSLPEIDRPDRTEPMAVTARNAPRQAGDRYSVANLDVWQTMQARRRAMLRLFADRLGGRDLSSLWLSEVGCDGGENLIDLLRTGSPPERLSGRELLPECAATARQVLPAALNVFEGDALHGPLAPTSQDIVFQSVVFSSLLDDAFQQRLAERIWSSVPSAVRCFDATSPTTIWPTAMRPE